MMARIHGQAGVLFYVGQIGEQAGVLAADVGDYTLEFRQETIDITGFGAPYRQYVPGVRTYEARFSMENVKIDTADDESVGTLIWRELQKWAGDNPGQWPEQVAALLALAARHPEEYQQLQEEETRRRFHFKVRRKGAGFTFRRS